MQIPEKESHGKLNTNFKQHFDIAMKGYLTTTIKKKPKNY